MSISETADLRNSEENLDTMTLKRAEAFVRTVGLLDLAELREAVRSFLGSVRREGVNKQTKSQQ